MTNNLNSILIEGNMVRDPLFRSTPKGTPVCVFSLASNRYFKQDSGLEQEVSFFEVETWAKLAEHCYSAGHKGRGIRVVGRLKQARWVGPDGKGRSKITIVAEHVEFRPEFKKSTGPGEYSQGNEPPSPDPMERHGESLSALAAEDAYIAGEETPSHLQAAAF
ncbi:MAG: single-stranded DNA-binding protein [Treponema sp.]|jgi:single-strand DNA-binding protein|nr:single-stranded DNA-binding protein [Treponema sp.]